MSKLISGSLVVLLAQTNAVNGQELPLPIGGISEVKAQNMMSAFREKLSSFREERPGPIAALEQLVRERGVDAYYQSLGDKVATIPCGTSKGYILSDGLSVLGGLQTIVLGELPGEHSSEMASAMARYNRMIQKIREDADPTFLSPQGEEKISFLGFLARAGEFLWDGKVIRKTADENQYRLHNKLFSRDSGVERFQANVYYLDEGRGTINIDYSPSHYQIIRNIRDEIRQVDEHLYLGKAFYKGTNTSEEKLILYFALDFSQSPRCETLQEKEEGWVLPENYRELSACEKRDLLWDHATSSQYQNLPNLEGADAFGLLSQTLTGALRKKMDYISDVIPNGWSKPIHSRGSMAQVRFNANPELSGHSYTGMFQQGASCALVRLSLTANPHQKSFGMGPERGVAPGLALKFFVDGQDSQDISLLTSLTGQGDNYNFFTHGFSNQVQAGNTPDLVVVHHFFETVSTYPERLSVAGVAEWTSDGQQLSSPKAPSKIDFVPIYEGMAREEGEEDIRTRFHHIPEGSTLFKVYAVVDSDYDDPADGPHGGRFYLGDIVTTSEFISSQFGDGGIFFKHRRFERDHQRNKQY